MPEGVEAREPDPETRHILGSAMNESPQHRMESGRDSRRGVVAATAAAAVLVASIGAWAILRHRESPRPVANGEIVFVSIQGADTGDLYSVMPDGSSLQRLTTSRDMTVTFATSPDGSKIAFSNGSE